MEFNYSIVEAFNMTCELNQYKLLEHTQKLPKIAFYIALIMLLSLLFWMFIQPRLRKLDNILNNEVIRFVAGLSIFEVLILLYTSFDFTQATFKKIELGLWIIMIILIILVGWKYYQNWKKDME